MASWTSLVGQWLGLCASSAGGLVSIPGWGIKIPDTKQSNKIKKKISQHAEGCLCVLMPLPLKQVKEGGGKAGGSFRDGREGTGGPVFAL